MKKLFFILTVSLVAVSVFATKRALVIGIGNYPAESGWAKINGDKDIPIVESVLLKNGFQKQNIVELQNEKATAAAIRKEMESLVAKAQPGDIIYIHFSGHGQQVTDAHGDEEDGFDEAWVAYDAQFAFSKGKYEGQNHILDDQLNGWLSRIRSRIGASGKITVVADACHSGDGSRGDEENEELVVRGTSDAFVIPGVSKPFSGISGKDIQWTFISACKPYQCNYEYKGTGSLTYALSQETALGTTTCKQVQKSIRTTISEVIPFTQTPVVEYTIGGEQQTLF